MAEESRFAKIARVRVTQDAASQLTFAEFQTGVGLQVSAVKGKGTAWLVDQIDYYVRNLATVQVANGDVIRYAITTSDQVTALEDAQDQRVLHTAERSLLFTTSGSVIRTQPDSYQFFPALIWAEPTLFVASDGESLAAAADVVARIYFRIIELDVQLIFEVAQQFRIIS